MKTLGQLAATFTEAMRLWDIQKSQGMPRLERLKSLETILRAAWPRRREAEWKFACEACNDTGLRMDVCVGDATCGRIKAHLPHDFGSPCWCQKGARFRDAPKAETDELAAIGKMRKPSRIGR